MGFLAKASTADAPAPALWHLLGAADSVVPTFLTTDRPTTTTRCLSFTGLAQAAAVRCSYMSSPATPSTSTDRRSAQRTNSEARRR